jgi:hypothetical protein
MSDDSVYSYSQAPLAVDVFDEDAPLTDYPEGHSILPVSAEAEWRGNAVAGLVATTRTGDAGEQNIVLTNGVTGDRSWNPSDSEWRGWRSPYGATQIFTLESFEEDDFDEGNQIDGYDSGLTIWSVPASANVNGTGHAGIVTTLVNTEWTAGKQTFFDATSGTEYVRYSSGGVWSSWV